eukprot:2076685-Prymnesium_polylepis.1
MRSASTRGRLHDRGRAARPMPGPYGSLPPCSRLPAARSQPEQGAARPAGRPVARPSTSRPGCG